MFCKKCGQKLSEGSAFCNKCGTKVEEIIDNVEIIEEFGYEAVEKVVETPADNGDAVINSTQNDNKKKIIKIGAIALVVVVVVAIFSSLFGGGNDYHGSYDDYETTEDNFGANNEIVTQPSTTEAITAATVDNIEVVYDDIIYSKHGSDWGAVKITDYNLMYTNNGQGLTIYINFEKVKNSERESAKSFSATIYFYDASGNVIDTSQALYVSNFRECEIGKTFRDECNYFGMLKANISAQAITKIEIIGG